MDVFSILQHVEKAITNKKEHEYFLVHEARYKYILGHLSRLGNLGSNVALRQAQGQNPQKKKSLRILDVGCYPYHMGAALEQLGHTVYGISSKHEPIKNTRVAILNIEKDRFPYKENTFDLVLCSEVLEHLPQSPVFALAEMHRVTKSNGYLIVTTPNIARSINRAKLLAGRSIMYPVEAFFEEHNKGGNLYH